MAAPTARQAIRRLSQVVVRVLTRTKAEGRENIPASGPLLILANHTSTVDPLLLGAFLPQEAEFVGPGDFKLLFPANLIIAWYGLIPVKRSLQLERSSLKAMTDVLKAGKMLALFPQGGTWEKSIYDAKSGAAYLSMTAGAPILPVGIGGAYQAWGKIARLQRPLMTVRFGKVMPAVQTPAERSKRGDVLDAATHEIMRHIYDLLPEADRAWYDDLARRQYHLQVEVWRKNGHRERVELPGGAVLAEVIQKPNLISPLLNNAKLPIQPLLKREIHFPPDLVLHAAVALQAALHGPFEGYMEYRLGEEKARHLESALDALAALAEGDTVQKIALLPESTLP